jgi:hypothetical protein
MIKRDCTAMRKWKISSPSFTPGKFSDSQILVHFVTMNLSLCTTHVTGNGVLGIYSAGIKDHSVITCHGTMAHDLTGWFNKAK